jgi:hypothetical protein
VDHLLHLVGLVTHVGKDDQPVLGEAGPGVSWNHEGAEEDYEDEGETQGRRAFAAT